MPEKTLNDLFLAHLKDIYYAEKKIYRTLPKMVKAANDAELKKAALVRTGLTQHNLPADCSNDRADECSTWTNSSKAAISIAK